ncbi:TRAF3-interacting JNK-activating modulator isoform X1 [Scleropages formosus]|uniref:TRAF3-interacting JNK-activating modulator-like n=1 Tax=Scleropages formosus TaxID=113540 RepID=A0A8C9V4C1_SCLFO|nr:TRAF3-interacting JNK-activating modulator isoform X1 [Scleropages formosus]
MTTIKSTQKLRSPVGSYDQKLDQRVVKHECLRDRNNTTTCRSPTRMRDMEWKRNELQRKRQKEFLKRRQIDQTVVPLVAEVNKKPTVVLRVNSRKANPLDRRSLVMAEDLGIAWPDPASIKQAPWMQPAGHLNWESEVRERHVTNRSTHIFPLLRERTPLERACTKMDRGTQTQDGLLNNQHSQRDISAQTEAGLITVKESDLLQLADYLQEALWREENLKHKVAFLQQSTSALLLSSDKLWMTRCSEDLTRTRIEALESQLQVCAQKFRRDGVKKLVLQMEEQKRTYEEKAVAALQKAMTEKMDAEKKLEDLEGALQAARAESARWEGLYLELKESCEVLRRSQEETTDKLHQLQSHLERGEGQEAELRCQLQVLQLEGAELCSQIAQLEEDNQLKQEQLQEMRGKLCHLEDPSLSGSFFQSPSRDMWNSIAQLCVSDGRPTVGPAPDSESTAEARLQAELQETQQRLTMKEKECTDLQAELEAVEHECQSCLFRLNQCREELRRLNARQSQSSCCSWVGVGLLLGMTMVALLLLLMYSPMYADQLHGVCRSLRQSVERYLQEMTSPKHSGCYRPV